MSTKDLLEKLNEIVGQTESLGEILRSIRLCDEMSVLEFANLLGISDAYLSDLEQGRKRISAKTAYEYAEKLGYPATEFIRLALQDEVNYFMKKTGHHAHVALTID